MARPSLETIRVRRLAGARLPCGPVFFRYGRAGRMLWAIDEAQIDPILANALTDFGNLALDMLHLPGVDPYGVRVHRDHSLGGDQLLAADVGDTIDLRLPAELATADVARHLELHATVVLRNVKRMLPILGESSSPPPAA